MTDAGQRLKDAIEQVAKSFDLQLTERMILSSIGGQLQKRLEKADMATVRENILSVVRVLVSIGGGEVVHVLEDDTHTIHFYQG